MPSNGRLDEKQLVQLVNFAPIQSGAKGLATPTVAHQWELMAAHFQHDTGKILYASEGYRDYARQVALKQAQNAGSGVLAATPGYSNHGDAVAIDVGSGVGVKAGPEYAWMATHAAAYGFTNDVATEGWHWHYCLTPTITTATATIAAALTITKEDLMKLYLLHTKKGGLQYIVENRAGQFIGLVQPRAGAWKAVVEKAYGVKAIDIDENDFYAMKQLAKGKNS